MFRFTWTARCDADDADEERGIAAAYAMCEEEGFGPATVYAEMLEAIEAVPPTEDDYKAMDNWCVVEAAALDAMCEGWARRTQNATLVWENTDA